MVPSCFFEAVCGTEMGIGLQAVNLNQQQRGNCNLLQKWRFGAGQGATLDRVQHGIKENDGDLAAWDGMGVLQKPVEMRLPPR